LRQRNGGLPGVEALTLPYSLSRWEVACNLLQPHQASAQDVERVAYEWAKELSRQNDEVEHEVMGIIESTYRVGTTREVCLDVFRSVISSIEARHQHDVSIVQQLSTCFLNPKRDDSSEFK